MKYVISTNSEWDIVYCTSIDRKAPLYSQLDKIASAMMRPNFEKFNKEDHTCANNKGIHDDSSLFTATENSVRYIWEFGGDATDMTGFYVPNLYRVRKIGIMIE